MKATKSPRKVVSGNPSPSKTRATNRDDDESKSISQLLQLLESQLDRHIDDNRNDKHGGGVTAAEIAAIRSSLETNVLPKLRSLESTLQPINRLPNSVLVLIPHFFTQEEEGLDYCHFPMNKPLIMMTHVCRSWRNVLLSTASLWTQIDFTMSTKSQRESFLRRSGNQPLRIYEYLDNENNIGLFLSTTLKNLSRLQELKISSCIPGLRHLLMNFHVSAPELKHLEIANDVNMTEMDIKLPTIFGGQMQKLTSLKLLSLRTNLRDFDFPSLTRFTFDTGTNISIKDLTSFFERCPSLEFIQIDLSYVPQSTTAPPRRRVCLATLRELKLDQTACAVGLLDQLALPRCTEMTLKGKFTGEALDPRGFPTARIHSSSIAHLPPTRGITKAVAMPNSCTFSGPNGTLNFWCFDENRRDFDAEFFTSFSPISVSQIRELWVGQRTATFSRVAKKPWKQTTARVRGAFEVLTEVEDLTIVSCETKPFFTTLGGTVNDEVLLPKLQTITIYIGCGDLDILALIRCAKARKKHMRPLEEVTVVWEDDPEDDVMEEVEPLREFVGELTQRVGETPKLSWKGDGCDDW